ncbi:MAG: hypothetical protein ABW170_01240 [Candidatus Thiodiazotropha sp. L084R]
MTRTAGALIGRRRSSAFWGLGCPKTHHEIKDSLGYMSVIAKLVLIQAVYMVMIPVQVTRLIHYAQLQQRWRLSIVVVIWLSVVAVSGTTIQL